MYGENQEIYVKTGGSDSNSGTEASPYQTIAKAISVAGAYARIILGAGDFTPTGSISSTVGLHLVGQGPRRTRVTFPNTTVNGLIVNNRVTIDNLWIAGVARGAGTFQFPITDNGSPYQGVELVDAFVSGNTDCIYAIGGSSIRASRTGFLTNWDYGAADSGSVIEFIDCQAEIIGLPATVGGIATNTSQPNTLGGVQANNYSRIRLENLILRVWAQDADGLPTVAATANLSRLTKLFYVDSTAFMDIHSRNSIQLPGETYQQFRVDSGGTMKIFESCYPMQGIVGTGAPIIINSPINEPGQIAPGAISATANANVVSYGGSTGAVSNDPVSGLPNVNAAYVGGISGAIFGASGDPTTLTIKNQASVVIPGAAVWVSSDSAGRSVVAGTAFTLSNGNVTFRLSNGQTYYLWMTKSGEQPINGQAFVAVKD